MAEPTKEWRSYDDFGVTQNELYENISADSLPVLRNKAANWAFGSDLTKEVQEKVISSLQDLKPTIPKTVQYFPRIDLRQAASGLTFELFGAGTRRVSVISYYRGELKNERVILEKTTNSRMLMPSHMSKN